MDGDRPGSGVVRDGTCSARTAYSPRTSAIAATAATPNGASRRHFLLGLAKKRTDLS
jgi:hypothetical protein